MNSFPKDTNAIFADSRMYSYSKSCNILFTTELAKKLTGTRVTVNALHPGAVETEICRRVPEVFKLIMNPIINLYFKVSVIEFTLGIIKILNKKYRNFTEIV